MARRVVLVMVVALVLSGSTTVVADGEVPWSAASAHVVDLVAAGAPLVVHVRVPLCHEAQIACGGGGFGRPGSLRTNLYWGALYGARRFFDRPELGWERVNQTSEVEGVLERAVYRRRVDGAAWGRSSSVEALVVLDAVHGDAIDRAVLEFHGEAARGADVTIDDGDARRTLAVAVAGYAGHNRMMDGLELPQVDDAGTALPSFVLACFSESYFGDALRRAGSTPLVLTRQLMAPEGYVVEATARALVENASRAALRDRVVKAYARWQRIAPATASTLFSSLRVADRTERR